MSATLTRRPDALCPHGRQPVLTNFGRTHACPACEAQASWTRYRKMAGQTVLAALLSEAGIYQAPLGRPSKPLAACINCGAPREVHRCTYCLSVTP